MTSASYNVAGQPIGLTYGSTDSDSFNYDSNTSRTTAFHLPTMNGTLTWNANGSLGAMSITDQINPPNAQSCSFTHDDLSRVASVNCGPIWSQTFSYDAFGNISKSGTSSFQPTYSSTTNRMTSLPGFTPTYDANGNLLNDSLHIYTWDAEGRPVTVDSVGLTYDALGRMVEQNRSGVYSQIVYAPTGNKLAIMSGQTLQKAFVPLIAGAQAVYTLAGLAYYRHPDWLGSSRLASTAGQSVYYEGAYAPFGESYAELGSTDRSFTGQNQGTVVGLYDFMFRQYSPVQGRWASPDPAGLAAVSAVNPQSWNRYGYVAGNPLNAVDPLGLVLKHSDLSTSSWWRPFGTSYASAYNAFGFFPGALSTIGGSWTFGVIEGSTIESNEYTSAGTWIEGSTLISVSNSYGWILTSSPGSAAFIGGTGGSWAKDFATALFWTFSAKSARQKGESFRDCVSRVRGAGGSFTTAVDAVSGVGAVNTALTARIGSTTYSVWRVWGGHGWAETTVTARNLSNLEAIATAAVGKGMIPPAWAAGAENWTAATAKVSGITTAVAVGLEGGTLGACTF